MALPKILDEILRWKREQIEQRKRAVPLETLRVAAENAPLPRDLTAALQEPGVSLIAEVKRASPSKGLLRGGLDAATLAREYEAGGSSAISVLTDERYFRGSLDDLRAVRGSVRLPLLRKDFILDAYQVYESRAAGADAVLLIVAALNDGELRTLHDLIRDLGMAALVEVHDAIELTRALRIEPQVIGVNNRDLHTFHVDLETSARLRPLVPPGVLLVAESGIHTRADVERLAATGVDAMLVGESLVCAPDVGKHIRQLLGAPRTTNHGTRVKICGLTNLDDARCAAAAGADFLGFIFYPKSPRYVAPEGIVSITRAIRDECGPKAPRLVGVFVNEPVERVRSVLGVAGLDLAQLHGDEPPDAVRHLQPHAFKAIRPQSHDDAEARVATYCDVVAADERLPQLLLDAYHPERYGGTGLRADLDLARAVASRCRLLLAGGLTPENVATAVAHVRPWGVDVSSGVERAKGLKDHDRVRAFIQAARGAS
jgi:indole-3-glycerol phosphate synthase/phosphoribosylanthranilate isomerase